MNTAELDKWGAAVARMAAVAWRLSNDDARESFRAEGAALASAIAGRRKEMDALRADLPPSLAWHGRVIDVDRALASLERQLQAALAVVDNRDGSGDAQVPLPGAPLGRWPRR